MGRKAKPTHLKIVEGNPGKRPLNAKEPKPRGALPTCPNHIIGPAKSEWQRVSKELHELGLLTRLDRAPLGAYCMAYGRWVQAERAIAKMAEKDLLTEGLLIKTTNGNPIQNPLVGIANKAHADMTRYAAEFGMTPSARSRIEVDGGKNETDTDRFF